MKNFEKFAGKIEIKVKKKELRNERDLEDPILDFAKQEIKIKKVKRDSAQTNPNPSRSGNIR